LIQAAIQSDLANTCVSIPATVLSYDAAEKTITAQPVVTRPVQTEAGVIAYEQWPPIQNVPVGYRGAASFSEVFPLAKGDVVVLVFQDYSIATWRARGLVSDPPDVRHHGPSYPVALPWYRPEGGPGEDSRASIGKPGGLRLYFEEAAVEVGDGSDNVAMASPVKARFDALAAALNGWVPVPNDGGAALKAALASWLGGPNDVASANLKAD
jgi:hypothetical protein